MVKNILLSSNDSQVRMTWTKLGKVFVLIDYEEGVLLSFNSVSLKQKSCASHVPLISV